MFREYLRELGQIELLRPEEEEALWRAFKEENCRKSRQRLIEAYQPLVFKIALQITDDEALAVELIQEGTVGLIEAVESYLPARGVKFSRFAGHRIRGRMLDFLRQSLRGAVYLPEGEVDHVLAGGSSLDEEILGREALRTVLGRALARLSQRERLILEGLYLEDRPPRELALELGISPSYLYKTQKKALRRLRGFLAKEKAELKALR